MRALDIKNEFEGAVLPVARLLGHALAAALGFCALGLISLIPIVVVRLLLWLGFAELAGPLRMLDLAPDGKNFVVVEFATPATGLHGTVHVNFLLNFFDELRRRMPVK